MKRTMYEVLEELQTDFRGLQTYIDEYKKEKKDLSDGVLKEIIRWLISDYLIPELEELSELLDD